jgi:hypothetical protein
MTSLERCAMCGKLARPTRGGWDGLCPKCEMATWSPEKRAAINNLIGLAFVQDPAREPEIGPAVDKALKHIESSSQGDV